MLDKHSLRQMDRLVRYGRDDLISNSPIAEKHVATGLTLRELCDAAVRGVSAAVPSSPSDIRAWARGPIGQISVVARHPPSQQPGEPSRSEHSPGGVPAVIEATGTNEWNAVSSWRRDPFEHQRTEVHVALDLFLRFADRRVRSVFVDRWQPPLLGDTV
ncbi:hypothetical protein GCM10010207_34520 [Streptomyces atratus]|nr:hypothetical protein GCM10010207_34520 [Streptomyces atratus]